QAKKTPQRTAVVDAAGTWSYEELETISNRIAHFLVQRGIKSGDVVAVYASASAGFICSLLGALKAGATFFVLDPEYPARRLLRSLRKAQPSALLYLQAAGELPPELTEFFAGACLNCRLDLPAGRAELIRSFLSLYSTTDPNMQVGPDDPAYLAFTSGSTGEPLGILGTHRPVSHFLQWHIRTFQLNEQDRFSLLSGLSHDPLLRDSFTALWMGASVHIPPAGEKEIEGGLARWMQREAITVAHLSPSMAEMLCRDGVELPALRRAFFHGDRLTYGDLQRLHRSAAGCRFVNYYGATETPQANGHYPVEMEALERHQAGEPVPLGSGIEGVQLLILNRAGQPAGIGEPGEICIRTPYLSRGYLDEERLTQQRFQTNPFTGSPEDRMYRTGDLGRYRPDGTVEFLARRDHQIKLRGFRIEPREIEAALEEQPAVRQAVIIPVESGGELQLVACLLLNPQDAQDPSFSGDQCRRFLAERIPAYMVPSGIVTFEALPLTPNGKIDRQALAAAAQSAAVKREFVPPGDQTETALARIWQEVLGVEQVGATDNFFALGGHSLKATQVASRIHREFGVRPPLRDLFRFPTIRELAPQLHVNQPQPHRRIEPAPAAEDYPASHAQRRLWALCQIDDAFAAYNMPRALLFDGELDRAAFEQALIELGRRHESLRTTFKVVGGRLRQQVHPEPGFRVQDVDLTRESDPMHRAEELADEDAARPFELETGPLLRASILQISSNRYLLLFNLHHIIADAWSLHVLIREFAQLYRARRGAPNSGSLRLPPLSIQYKDYACWQNALLEGEEAVRHLEYWRQRLSGERPALELPADRTRPPVKTYHGRRLHFVFEAGETRALNDFSRERQASLYMTLVAAVKALLYRYTDQQEILTGCPVAGRNHVDLENQIGFYVNMLPLRDRVAGDQGFAELLQQVKQTAAEAYEHQDYPFDRLVEELNIPRDVSRSPLFEVVVVLQNAEASELQMEGVNIAPFDRETRTSKFDLNFTFEQQNDRLRGFIEFNSDLFFEDRVERMAQHLRTLIGSALSEPGRAVDRLNLLPEAERERVLVEFNSTAASYPETATIVDLFEEQVKITPDAIAVRFDDRRLTYRQLNSQANALARRLREEFHIAPNDLIGVVLDRSERIITTLLAVLKAGGAYIPIDPA
ncbi:MAG TPA: amino acid adenylation domain-containing protein, partial [Blastocatellia bacterium]|nr:amino acid adenylation domain-containing protein [Blastocatellia bacterium]